MSLGPGEQPVLPRNSRSINGSTDEVVERSKLREICEGFPCHRDASEWAKFRALFAAEDAYVWTTWSGGIPVDEFIKVSKAGFKAGARIMHRASGFTVDVADSGRAAGRRALGKLKATITQRFVLPCAQGGDCEVDIEAQCRLCFFLQRDDAGDWAIRYFKGICPSSEPRRFSLLTLHADEKDKCIAVRPDRVPTFDEAKLAQQPDGYRFLAYAQSATNKILMDLPQLRGEVHDRFYVTFTHWLDGEDIAEEMGLGRAH